MATKVIELDTLNQEDVTKLLEEFETLQSTERGRRYDDPVDCVVKNLLQYDMFKPVVKQPLDRLALEAGVDRKVILELLVGQFMNQPSLVTT